MTIGFKCYIIDTDSRSVPVGKENSMYPDVVFMGMSLYEIFIVVGVIYAFAVYRILSDRDKSKAKYQNFVILCGVMAIVGGYICAVLFQAVYNYFASGVFEVTLQTGATFYGGLIGGAAVFLLLYFAVGPRLFKEKYHLYRFIRLTDIAAAAISGAHAFGRIGCLMAGCCYGRPTDSFIGIYNQTLGCKTVPIQLFEAIFLFGLSAFFLFRCIKGKTYGLSIYLSAYGIWRFFIEYLRYDDRGATLFGVLTPSQLTAILLTLVGLIGIPIVKKLSSGGSHEG